MNDAPEDGSTERRSRFNPPFHRTLGVKMRIGPNREGIAYIDVDPEVHYGSRWAHGGMAGVLADIASGIAIAVAMGEEGRGAIDGTVEFKVNFLRKVYDGDGRPSREAPRRDGHRRHEQRRPVREGRGDLHARSESRRGFAPPTHHAIGTRHGRPSADRPHARDARGSGRRRG